MARSSSCFAANDVTDAAPKGGRTTEPSGSVVVALARLRLGVYWSAVGIFVATVTTLFVALLVNAVLRYLVAKGITWAYEIPAILFPWAVAGAVVVATALGRNIQVALLAALLPSGARRLVGLSVCFVVAAVSLGVVWTSLPTLKASQFMRLAETGIPQIYGMSSLIYAFSMIALIAAIDFVHLLAGAGYADDIAAESSFS